MWIGPRVIKLCFSIDPSAQVLETLLSRASSASLFRFTVNGRCWRQITGCERFKRGKGGMVQVIQSPILR
jgi:hypothetical protein